MMNVTVFVFDRFFVLTFFPYALDHCVEGRGKPSRLLWNSWNM